MDSDICLSEIFSIFDFLSVHLSFCQLQLLLHYAEVILWEIHDRYVTLVWCHKNLSSQKCLEVMIISTAMSCTKAVCAHCINKYDTLLSDLINLNYRNHSSTFTYLLENHGWNWDNNYTVYWCIIGCGVIEQNKISNSYGNYCITL